MILLALAACTSGPKPTNTAADGGSGGPATSPAAVASEVPPAAFLLDLETGAKTPLPTTPTEDGSGVPFDAGYYYFPSPDGSMMYFEDPDGNASVLALSDGSQGRRLDPPGDIDYYAGGWSPDGTKIVYQRRDSSGDDFGNLVVEDIASGRTTRITDLEQSSDDVDGWWYLAPTFSPDGKNVIFHWPRAVSSGIKWNLLSVPVTRGEPTLLVRNAAQAATSGVSTFAFVRPVADFFGGSSIVLATPNGVRTLAEATWKDIFEPKMSPDGSKIVYSDDGTITVVNVSTGETSDVAEAHGRVGRRGHPDRGPRQRLTLGPREGRSSSS